MAGTLYTFAPNSLDLLNGAKAFMQSGDWVTAGGAATVYDNGYMKDMEVEISSDLKEVDADNALMPITGYYTGRKVLIKGTVQQQDLDRFAEFIGDAAAQVVTVARSAGATDGTVTYNIDEPSTPRFRQVYLIVPQSRKPGATDVYTRRTYCLWRCLVSIKGGMPFGKSKESAYKVEIHGFLDDSVAAVSTIFRRLGIITDYVVK